MKLSPFVYIGLLLVLVGAVLLKISTPETSGMSINEKLLAAESYQRIQGLVELKAFLPAALLILIGVRVSRFKPKARRARPLTSAQLPITDPSYVRRQNELLTAHARQTLRHLESSREALLPQMRIEPR